MTSTNERDDSSIFNGLMEKDEKDKAKRVSRNKSEKKRREKFNALIKELGTMLPGNTRKVDKSTILQKSIDFLCKHKEIAAQSESTDIRLDWKPPFLTNKEFMHLMLEALDGFFLAVMTDGNIIYISESVTSLLEHLPSDLLDQNLLNFLPVEEHSDVYKALSLHITDAKNHLEFCCHILRGAVDPKEPPVYEYVKFTGNFKSLNNVSKSTQNGFEEVIQRSHHSAFEDRVCLIATVRLAKPQFIKEMCTTEEPNEEFTSRHSLEWKFLFLDHRAPPIIGYLPFEVLGTSGYDYYHVDDLETLAKCHEHLMQYGKGKSCYYRFLTKGQQWIWLQTHYYITYHQWNSRPEFIVCTHSVVSYAVVRAEQRRELGIEESPCEISADKHSQHPDSESQINTSSIMDILEHLDRSCPPSASSRSSRKSSQTVMSNPASSQVKLQEDRHIPDYQSAAEVTLQRRSSVSSEQSVSCPNTVQSVAQSLVSRPSEKVQTSGQSGDRFSSNLDAVQHLKEQLQQRTRLIETNIQRQEDELRQIQDELQKVQGQSLQMFLQKGSGVFNVSSVQMALGNAVQQGGAHSTQGQVASTGTLQNSMQQPQSQQQTLTREQSTALSQSHHLSFTGQPQQSPLPSALYNTVMISQQSPANTVQFATNPSQNSGSNSSAVGTFPQDCAAQIRFPAGPQLFTKLVTGQMTCGAVMVPTTMFMGQVVTAFAPQQAQAQTISITQQPPQHHQQQEPRTQPQTPVTAMQPMQTALSQQQTHFLQAPQLLHGNQSAQLILQAAFPLQQQGTFTTTTPQQHLHRLLKGQKQQFQQQLEELDFGSTRSKPRV
ncbi:circadian locomoter output cycles protein kaput isoform X2 [Thalassophryne amazonica]|uniref:circadian locomoter output cycles protein kaput isoform X1 n=1 Tax=Thalassophryne amazonica TaxID=390379 RepID=UPI0014720B15|nr:circadian locomoter output cycles protein kaput isoform X1 [Thalassophryne amazonica]XP_034036389.1 circadian locomoter output cycles protein kaput isoform X2 [Thalassophryne amazonica]